MKESLYSLDYYRYYGYTKRNLFKEMFLPMELRFLKAFRKAQYYRNKKCFFLLYLFWESKKRILSRRTHLQIPTVTSIGPGMYIGHFGRVIINPRTIIGKNLTINTGVTIGQTNRGKRQGVPVIGDDVWIGTIAVVVGGIKIGSDVLIAPNAYVNFDVPSHSIVIGNPGTIIPNEYATKGYIEHPV